jgi:uncharacterized membrane protein
MGNDLAAFLGLCLIILYLGVIIFLITLLWRITRALERMARHQLEMARDLKRIADASVPNEPS